MQENNPGSNQKGVREDLPAGSTRPRFYFLVLAATLSLALVLRVWNLGSASLWYDEAMYGWLARNFHVDLLSGRFILVEPLFVWPLSWWVRWSDADWWLRLPSVVAGVLAVGAGASTARVLAGKRAALCAALVLAVAPALIYYSRDAKMYAWVFLWLMCVTRAAVAFALEPGRLRHLCLYVLAGTALCYTHFAAPIFLAVSGVGFLILFARTFRVVVQWILANAIIVVLAIPFILVELRYQEAMRGYIFHAPPPDLRSLQIAFAHFFTAYTTFETLRVVAPWFFVPLALLGVLKLRGQRAPMLFLLALGMVPMLLLFAISTVAPWSLFVDRYIIASSAPLLVAASITLGTFRRITVRLSGLLLCVLLSSLALPNVYRHTLPRDPRQRLGLIPRPDAAKMAGILRKEAKAGETVFHVTWETEPALRWYAPEFRHVLSDYQGLMRISLDNVAPLEYQEFYGWNPVDVRLMAASVPRAWLVFPTSDDALTSNYTGVIEELEARGRLVFSETCGEAVLQCYDFAASEDGNGWRRKTALVTFPNAFGGGNLEFRLDPSEQGEPAAFDLTLQNHTDRAVFFQFEAVPCAAAVGGSALMPRLEADSKWTRSAYLAAGVFRNAAIFRAHPKAPRGDDLAACLRLPPGEYAVYLERTVEGSGYVIPAAAIHINIAGQRTSTLASTGIGGATRSGWVWERLGSVRFNQAPVGLILSVDDPQQRPEAYGVFSQLVFVKQGAMLPESSPPGTFHESVTCPANGTVTKTLRSSEDADCLLVQGTVMDYGVCLVEARESDIAVLTYRDCAGLPNPPGQASNCE